MPGWMNHKLVSTFLGEISTIHHLRYADDSTLMAESEEELKSLLITLKEESKKSGLNSFKPASRFKNEDYGIRSHHFMANRWENSGNSGWLYFSGPQNHCSHEIKRWLLLGRNIMTNLDSILKSRDITLPTKAHLAKAMVFPVVMCGCESWTIKKAECWIIDAFELFCGEDSSEFLGLQGDPTSPS